MSLADVAHLEVQDAFTGEYVPLADTWGDKPVVVGFFRRFGCMLCRYAAVQLSTLQEFLDVAGVRLVAVGFEAVGLQAFVDGNFFSGDIYLDLSRACYRGLKLENLGFLRGMAMLLTDRRVASTLKEARNVAYGDFRGDGMQLGATFVVGSDGTVFMEHRQKHFGDNPDLNEIRQAAALAVNKSVEWIEAEMAARRGHGLNSTHPLPHPASHANSTNPLFTAQAGSVGAGSNSSNRSSHSSTHSSTHSSNDPRYSSRSSSHQQQMSGRPPLVASGSVQSDSTEDVESIHDSASTSNNSSNSAGRTTPPSRTPTTNPATPGLMSHAAPHVPASLWAALTAGGERTTAAMQTMAAAQSGMCGLREECFSPLLDDGASSAGDMGDDNGNDCDGCGGSSSNNNNNNNNNDNNNTACAPCFDDGRVRAMTMTEAATCMHSASHSAQCACSASLQQAGVNTTQNAPTSHTHGRQGTSRGNGDDDLGDDFEDGVADYGDQYGYDFDEFGEEILG